jgi:hypothetical protein
MQALKEHSTAYANALFALEARGGIMPVAHFAIACGSPEAQKRHLAPKVILDRLEKANLVDRFDSAGIGPCVAFSHQFGHEHEIPAMRARMLAERILLNAVRTWAKNLGLVSFNKVTLRDEAAKQPRVGTFAWDLTAPSYVNPLRTRFNNVVKPGFLACDVLLSHVDEDGLRPFIHKCTTLAQLSSIGRTLNVFVAERFDLGALKEARRIGIVPATIRTLFGEDVAKGLREMMDVVRDATSRATDPAAIAEIFDSLSSIEGAATNLRGALFHYIAAELVRLKLAEPAAMDRLIKVPGKGDEPPKRAEADIVAVKGYTDVYFVECKGYKPLGVLPDDLIDKWLDTTIPIIREYALQHPDWKDLRLHFLFWTTAKFSPYATKRLMDASKSKRYEISFEDGAGISKIANDVRNQALKRTLNEHFLEHPLAKIERGAVRRERREARRLDLAAVTPVEVDEVSLDDEIEERSEIEIEIPF